MTSFLVLLINYQELFEVVEAERGRWVKQREFGSQGDDLLTQNFQGRCLSLTHTSAEIAKKHKSIVEQLSKLMPTFKIFFSDQNYRFLTYRPKRPRKAQ